MSTRRCSWQIVSQHIDRCALPELHDGPHQEAIRTAVAFEDTFLASEEADNADTAHRVTCVTCSGPGPQCDAGLLLERAAIEAGKAHRAATAASRTAYAARRGT